VTVAVAEMYQCRAHPVRPFASHTHTELTLLL